jgi:N6-adenosine-specific RNA methylase IME4
VTAREVTPRGSFCVVVADPPWRFSDRLTMSATPRGAAANYPTLSTPDICALPVQAVTATTALLALWTPAALLEDGLAVLRAWSFVPKTIAVWAKTSCDGTGLAFGMGWLFRGACEIALVGTKGSPRPVSRSERNVWLSPALRHSAKPETLQDSLDRMFPEVPKLELFARRARPGWTCVGNQCPATYGEDIRDSLRAHAGDA